MCLTEMLNSIERTERGQREDREVCGVKMFNCAITNDVAMTITGQRVDSVNEPVVIIYEDSPA